MAADDHRRVPEATVERLPTYLRCLREARLGGVRVMNSERLAAASGSNASQVRKDLAHFGEMGIRGLGYDVESLAARLARLLGVETERRVAVVGFGRLGSAFLDYPGFASRGFLPVAVFDSDPAKIGAPAGGLAVEPVSDLGRICRDRGVEIVVIATPASAAGEVAAAAAEAGVRAILNLAPTVLEVPEGVVVRNADIASEMQVLSYHLPSGG